MLSKEEIQHIAKLARLELNEEETVKMGKELSQVLDYFRLLEELDVSKIEPRFYLLPLKNVMKQDEIRGCKEEERDSMLNQAPDREKDYVKVKEILK